MQSQKLATLGYLAAGMAHEIRNPLNSISLFVQLIKEGVEDSEKIEYVEKILQEVDRVDSTLRKLLDTAKRPRFELTEVNIEDVIQKDTRQLHSADERAKNNAGILAKERLPRLKADPAEIEQIFTNLFLNAIDEMPEGGELAIELDHDDQ